MRTKALIAAAAAALLVAAAILWGAGGGGSTTLANPGVVVGVDTDPTGNTATSLGSIQTSRTVACGDTFDIDIYIKDVTNLVLWHVFLNYNKDIIRPDARNVQMFPASAPGSEVADSSRGDPDFDGVYDLLAADDVAPESGSGVLARLTVKALKAGTTTLTLEDPFFLGPNLTQILLDPLQGGDITVSEGPCFPDTDGDGYSDPVDNCPQMPSQDRTDTDGDGQGNICDGDDDNDTVADENDNCPINANSDQADADGDGLGNVCDPTPGTPTATPTPTSTPGGSTPTPETSTPTPGTPTPTPPPGATVLVQGWNNACYVGAEGPIEDALGDVADKTLAVYRMRTDGGFDRWFAGRPDVSTIDSVGPYQPLFILMNELAYWMQESSGAAPASIALADGWNTVCYAGADKGVQDATAGIVDHIGVLYTLKSDQTWSRFIPERPEVSSLDRLESRTGVIVLITNGEVTWAFDS